MQKISMFLFLALFLLSCQPEEDEFTDLNLTVKTEVQDSKEKNEANRIRVRNIEALRKLPFPNTKNRKEVLVLGYYEPGDEGGGVFYWDPTSTDEDNGGTIIKVFLKDIGRWKRIVSGNKIFPEWFGAKGNSRNDDTFYIQNAINSGYENIIFNKDYLITSPIFLQNNIKMVINGRIKINKHGYRCIIIDQKKNIEIKGTGNIEGYGFFPENKLASLDGGGEKHFCFENGRNFPASYDGQNSNLGEFGDGFIGNGGSGIFIYGGRYIKIEGIVISGFNFSGICIGDPIKNNDPSHPISKHIFINCLISNIYDSGISILAAEDVVVGESTVVDKIGHPKAVNADKIIDPGYGITGRLTGSKGIPVKNLKISGKFNNCKRKGIDIHSGHDIEIVNFSVEESYIAGIALGSNKKNVYNIQISEGIIKNCGKQTISSIDRRGGLKISSEDVFLRNLTIENSGITESLYISGENINLEDVTINGGEIPERSFTINNARNVHVKNLLSFGYFKENPLIRNDAIFFPSLEITDSYCFDLLGDSKLSFIDCL